MVRFLGKIIGMIINIVMIPIVLVLAIPMGILKARRNQKTKLLFTGGEQSLLAKAQRTLNMDQNGLLSPDRDLLTVARCIEDARCEYQLIKSTEKFETFFIDFVIPKINKCNVTDWNNVVNFFDLPARVSSKTNIDTETDSDSYPTWSGGMRLHEAGVDILFMVKNDNVIYKNSESDHLFTEYSDGIEILDGRVVNFVFTGQSDNAEIEVFVAFDESDSDTMFTLQFGMNERLNYVAQSIFTHFSENGIENVFSPIDHYATQYIYTFKLYRKNDPSFMVQYFMVNNSQTEGYLIDDFGIERDDIDELKNIFWQHKEATKDFTDDIPF